MKRRRDDGRRGGRGSGGRGGSQGRGGDGGSESEAYEVAAGIGEEFVWEDSHLHCPRLDFANSVVFFFIIFFSFNCGKGV